MMIDGYTNSIMTLGKAEVNGDIGEAQQREFEQMLAS
jgi:hypothetical protein